MKKFNKGEVWRFNPDPTMGREQSKIRPCIIISVDEFNKGPADLLIIAPITSTNRGIPSHIATNASGLKNTSYIMCEQIRSISKIRMLDRMGVVNIRTMKQVEYWLSILLGINSESNTG